MGKREIIIIITLRKHFICPKSTNFCFIFFLTVLLAMSTTIISDRMVVSSTSPAPEIQSSNEVESVKCDCCGLTEECTPTYIERVRERYEGKWICGLCAEAVKDEIVRTQRLISTEEAMARHMSFCQEFISSSDQPPDPTVHLISAMRSILRRSLDSPRRLRSTPSSPTRKIGEIRGPGLARSESCFPTLSG